MLEVLLAFTLWGTSDQSVGTGMPLRELERCSYQEFSPWIADFYIENPNLAHTQPYVQNFFQVNPPDQLLRGIRKNAPSFYRLLKQSAFGDLPPAKQKPIRTQDLLGLPGPEIVYLVNVAGPPAHGLLISPGAEKTIDRVLPKNDENARLLLKMLMAEARQTNSKEFVRQALVVVGMIKAANRFE